MRCAKTHGRLWSGLAVGYTVVVMSVEPTTGDADSVAAAKVGTWSRSFTVSWAPCPRVYDEPGALIEALREKVQVVGFQVDRGTVRVTLRGGDEVTISVAGLAYVSTPRPPADLPSPEAVRGLLSEVVERLRPSVDHARFHFQHVFAWPSVAASAETACLEAVNRLFPVAPHLGLNDYALLADGTAASGRAFQLETGVIPEEQAIPRLARLIGRSMGPPVEEIDHLFEIEFAPVSTFVDTSWTIEHVSGLDADEIVAWLLSEGLACEQESAKLAARLHNLTHQDLREGAST